ncbi:MAG: AMP-binding protein [Actinomycetota bacterium]|nr:AMP-binding protein [Actinomycetota bacterium]
MVTAWNFADVWEIVAAERSRLPAIDQGSTHLNWKELDQRADALAAMLVGVGVGRQARVAQYLYNGPAYLVSVFASFKAGLVPVNTNYRYAADELVYLWDDGDVKVVIFDAAFEDRVDEVRGRLPRVRAWVRVGGSEPLPDWATSYEHAIATPVGGPVRAPWGRSGDDLLFIYTGGTTGMPKGVMWRQDDLWAILNRSGELRYPEGGNLADVRSVLRRPSRHPRPRLLPGPPLMHGTALFTAMSVFTSGGSVVLTDGHSFSAVEALETSARERVTQMTIVGDAFARPLLAELDAAPRRWDLSSLWLMVSSGVMWSAQVKAGLARHLPWLVMVDTLGSSEALGIGRSRSTGDSTTATGGFQLGHGARVVNEHGRDVIPGSGERGMLAVQGRGPVGYHKDPIRSASTFRIIDGERWTVPGDWAVVNADGSLTLLGRGSGCINTGGEKVFPEEVEEILKTHPSVADSVVVGVPDERFGEAVVAIVEPAGGAAIDEDILIGWVKDRLAGYKAPKRVLTVAGVSRAANGKVDYRRLRQQAIETLDEPSGRRVAGPG